ARRAQHRVVVPLDDDERIALEILARDEPCRAAAAARSADAQPLALADRVECQPVVFAYRATAVGDDRPRARREVAPEELAERALADEADPGRILALRIRQADRAGDLAHLALVQLAERE